MIQRLFLFLSLGILLTGCPDADNNKTQKEVEKNNLDLLNPKYIDRLGVRFALPEAFTTSYSGFTLKTTNSFCFSAEELSLYFSIEKFDDFEIESFRYQMEDADSLSELDVLTQYLKNKRVLSMDYPSASEPVELFSRTGKKGWIFSVEDREKYFYSSSNYLIAVIEHKNKHYAFQFVGGIEAIPFLFDDFIAILKSVK